MAKENDGPTSAEKGKGKAIEPPSSADGAKEPQKDKDGKPVKDGSKPELPEGMRLASISSCC